MHLKLVVNSFVVFDIDIDECVGNLCENAATCEDGINGYTCACVLGYTRTYCDIGEYIILYSSRHSSLSSMCRN